MLAIAIIIFLVLLFIGAPIWFVLGMSGGFLAVFGMNLPTANVPSHFFIAADSWILLAIPFFLLAGNLMTFMGTAHRMLSFIVHVVGHFRGGLAIAAVIACAIFGALSGSAVATVVAVGTMVIPHMLEAGYSKENSLGIVSASGTLGAMIPPSIIMILYASIVQVNVSDLFLAGIAPGIMLTILLVITAIIVSYREKAVGKSKSSRKEIGSSFVQAIPALLMPAVVLGGIYQGIFTPTEAAAIAVFYVLLISFIFERKNFTKNNLIKSIKGAVVTTAAIYIILGGVSLFSQSLTFSQVPQQITEYVATVNVPAWLVTLVIVLFLLLLGTFLEPGPILFITVPILLPTILNLGIDPIHFGIIMVICLMIAQITPPVGMTLFVLSSNFKTNVGVVIRGSLPYMYALIIGSIIILYFPWLSTFLVD
ncbi:TRAP transporter large permease [Neobacillus vireti]|uniref:TRAP transporter large permease n=1 Tax=Neobacillus vireti TaxID=220686 RepID=UPI002FFD75BB